MSLLELESSRSPESHVLAIRFLDRDRGVMKEHDFGQILSELMATRNVSARQLAKELGQPQKTVNGWVGPGGSMPRDSRVLKQLADYFEVSVHYLLYGSEDHRGPAAGFRIDDVFNGVFEINIKRLRIKPNGGGQDKP